MTDAIRHAGRRRGHAAARTIVGLAAVGLIVTGVVLSVRDPGTAVSASQVVTQVRDTVLAGARDRTDPRAGMIGSVHYGASEFDPVTHEFVDLRIESTEAIILAQRGRLEVDVDDDSVSFELTGVRFVPLPPEGKTGDPEDFREVERFRFGPIRWRDDIVPDAHGTPRETAPAPKTDSNLAQGSSVFDRAD